MSARSRIKLTLGTWLMVKTRRSLMRLSMIAAGGCAVCVCARASVCVCAAPFAKGCVAMLPLRLLPPPLPCQSHLEHAPRLEEEVEAACTQVRCGGVCVLRQ